MLDHLINLDTQLFIFLNNLGTDFWDPFWLRMSEIGIWIPLYLVLLGLVYYLFHWKTALLITGFIALNVIATDQGSVRLFKNQFERLRPCHVEELQDQIRLVKGSCGGQYGFVSSHASNTFGLAFFLGLLFRKKWPWLYYALLIWASLVAYSRVYLGVHYPGDILFGAIYGTLCGTLLFVLMDRWQEPKYKEGL